jgi:Uma2 family endonuclease
MSTQPKNFITPEQYLEIERKAEFKSEYYRGEMFARAVASWNHNRLVWKVINQLGQQLGSGPCRGVPSDMRVHVPATGLYTYPDVTIICGEPQFADDRDDTLLNPTLIVEVLSPSTEAYDRGRKFRHYQSIPSLQHYVLISSDHMQVDWYTRQPDAPWLFSSASSPDESITLQAIGCTLKLSDVYEGVELS